MKAFKILIVTFFIAGCSNHVTLELPEYKQWVNSEKSGLIKSKSINGILFEAKYKPLDYVACQEMERQKADPKQFNNIKKEFEGLEYFTLRISLDKVGGSVIKAQSESDEDYVSRKQYFYFNFEKDIFLEVAGKKYACTLYHFEDTYELSRYETFVMAFKVDEKYKNESKTLVVDSEIFNAGTVKLRFDAADIKNAPAISFS